MATLHVVPPAGVAPADSREAQDARWDAWKARGAASDRITQRRMRLLAAVLLMALIVTLVLLR